VHSGVLEDHGADLAKLIIKKFGRISLSFAADSVGGFMSLVKIADTYD